MKSNQANVSKHSLNAKGREMKVCKLPVVIDIPADVFAVVQKFAANGDVRYYLNGVYCSEKFLAATDGHCLMVSPFVGIAAKPSIIPQIPIQHLKKNNRVYVLEDNSVCVVNYRSEIVYHSPLDLIDGKFPDVINVIDKMGEWSDGTGAVPFDVAFLAKMTAQLKGGIRLFNSPSAICAVASGQYPVQPGAMVFVMGRRDTCLSPAEAMNRIRDGH